MNNNYSDELKAVKADLKSLKDDIAKLTRSVVDDTQQNANELSAKAKVKYGETKETVKKAGVQSKDKAHQAVTTNPFKSLAATAGVGLILGALFGRKK